MQHVRWFLQGSPSHHLYRHPRAQDEENLLQLRAPVQRAVTVPGHLLLFADYGHADFTAFLVFFCGFTVRSLLFAAEFHLYDRIQLL